MKKIKLDENFPPAFLPLFQSEAIDASSVYLQNIIGQTITLSLKYVRKREGLWSLSIWILPTSSVTQPTILLE
jgi:hypothetical protein